MQDAIYLNVEIPTDPVSATIPVTQGCDAKFVVNPVLVAEDGQQFPTDLALGAAVLVIEVNRTQTVRIDSTLDANTTVSFVIPAEIADSCTARSTWQIIRICALACPQVCDVSPGRREDPSI